MSSRGHGSGAVCALLLSCCYLGAAADARAQVSDSVPNERLVLVDPKVSDIQVVAADLRAATGATVEIVSDKIGVLKVTTPVAGGVQAAQAAGLAAANVAGVKAVDRNYLIEMTPAEGPEHHGAAPSDVGTMDTAPNDEYYDQLWYKNPLQLEKAWDLRTSSSILVAVIDSGYHLNHFDLASRWWVNDDEIAGNAIDDDANGYVDDTMGWDCIGDDNQPLCELYDTGAGQEWETHGTHVAGSIGAAGNNFFGISGVCWNVEIMPIRSGAGRTLPFDAIIEGFEYAVDNGAQIINCSFGGYGGEAIHEAYVQYALDQGVLVVAAAGNDTNDNDAFPAFPCSVDLPNVISVAALQRTDARALAYFSNYGATTVDLGTPGEEILSTVPLADFTTARVDDYQEFQGTSMASPITAGAAALVWAHEPTLTYAEVKQILLDSVDKFPAQLGGRCVSGGRLNVFKAMQLAVPPPPPSDPPTIDALTAVVVECTGDENLVEFETVIDDPDTATLTVRWRVDNVVRKTETGLAPGATVAFEYDYADGAHDVSAEVFDGDTRVLAETTVTVEDTTAPTIVVAANVTVPVDSGDIVATNVLLGTPDVDDLCDEDPTLTNNAPSSFPIGTTNVRWTATDKDGNVVRATQKVTVTNDAPRADAGRNQTESTPSDSAQATLDGTGSTDPNQHDLTYAWTAPGVTFEDPAAAQPTGAFPIGKTTATLVVTDEAGATATATVQVTVTKRNTVEFRYAGAIANYYASLGSYFGYYAAVSGGTENDYIGYELAIYAYLMGTYSGDSLVYGVTPATRDEALGDYMTYRYYQSLFAQYGYDYLYQSFAQTGNLYALYAYLYDYYANYYALADLSS